MIAPDRYMLDTTPLGQVCRPRWRAENSAALDRLDVRHREILIPEIADYELRRELIAQRFVPGLEILDGLARRHRYVPLDTETMRLAAQLWASLRGNGRLPSAPADLGADIILAAQAIQQRAAVITANARHLARMVETCTWTDL
jgi:predicted nucleic acid-binding protein